MATQTFPARPEDKAWYVIDAEGMPLGRLASRVAVVLRGKHKPIYSPHLDHGDHVVVINASKVALTGRKLEQKTYFRHTGYIGGAKTATVSGMLATRPEEVVRRAVKGMLPKTRLGRQMIRKLHIHAGPEHTHQSQSPQPMPADKRAAGE